jgi:thiol-disulfide isomerase/thioredoxin
MFLRTVSLLLSSLFAAASLAAQAPAPAVAPPPAPTQGQSPQSAASPPAAKKPAADDEAAKHTREAETELQHAISVAGNDRAALVRELEAYLVRFPDASRKPAIYRAIVESSQQLHDYPRALAYSERLIALNPDDSEMMMLASGLLENQGDEHSLVRAVGYVSRVLDRVEKNSLADKPARVSVEDFEQQQKRLRAVVYQIRGRLEREQHNYPLARKDLEQSFLLEPNAPAAEQLGEIAEASKDLPAAITQYTNAFVLPENGPAGAVDRHDLRKKLGNVWITVHGTEAGLGEAVLAAYDHLAVPEASKSPAVGHLEENKKARDAFGFVLRKLDGSPVALEALKGKVLVLSFWATWCGPCRELEPLFEQLARDFASNPDVAFFAVDTDEDETRVAPFVTQQKIGTPVVFSDGLDRFLDVRAIPTVLMIDRSGKISYRVNGLDMDGFVDSVTAAINQALGPAAGTPPPKAPGL